MSGHNAVEDAVRSLSLTDVASGRRRQRRPYRVVALDGHDLNGPVEMGVELLPVGTGQRYDLTFRMPASGRVRLLDVRPQAGGAEPARDRASLGEGALPKLNGSMPLFDRSKPLGYVSAN